VSRSSNDELSESLDDRNRFCLQLHDSALEATAQSQEHNARDTCHVKAPSPSKAQKKTDAKKEIILLTYLGGPPESSRHVSLFEYLSCSYMFLP
jgi:hypothetical protein